MPGAYNYDDLPEPLRNQIILACNGVVRRFGAVMVHGDLDLFYSVVKLKLCLEFGLVRLSDHIRTDEEDVWSFFLQEQTAEGCFDIIEIVLACMTQYVRADADVNLDGLNHIQGARDEINALFKAHAIGYELRDGRFDPLRQREGAPAITLVFDPGAEQELSRARDHFHHQRFGECIHECLKALESTMKAICEKRGWTYDQTDTAERLLAICEQNGLFPDSSQSSPSDLGRRVHGEIVLPARKLSGLGQGAQMVQILKNEAGFVLHYTGLYIINFVVFEQRLT